jgi:hypothetical protein
VSAARHDAGPPLPALLRRRFGVPAWATLAVAGVVAALAVAGILSALTRPPSPGRQVVHEGPPVFNLLYPPEALRSAPPGSGELLRLEGRRGRLSAAVVVRPLDLPPFEGDVTHGLLPSHANTFMEAEARRLPGFALLQEGRARVNNGVGYEFGYSGRDGRITGRQVLLVPDDPAEGRGFVLLSLRLERSGRLSPRDRGLAGVARKAYRSFRFGTERG